MINKFKKKILPNVGGGSVLSCVNIISSCLRIRSLNLRENEEHTDSGTDLKFVGLYQINGFMILLLANANSWPENSSLIH